MASLGLPAPSSVTTGGDPTATQMYSLANDLGMQLLAHPWQFLSRTLEITTTSASEYPLPMDFHCFELDSQWNRSTAMPMSGSLSAAEWEQVTQTRPGVSPLTILFRLSQDKIVFHSLPAEGQVLAFPYRSRNWSFRLSENLRTDQMFEEEDTPLYDSQLFKAGIRLEFLSAKRFDISRAKETYERLLKRALSTDAPARSFSLGPSCSSLLGTRNIPSTGFGQ
jgi:hypothetical protein